MKQRILIVDDSPLIHTVYGSELEEAGYEVLHSEDGISAINRTFVDMPDLIILDIHMPRINGYQVCRLLKDHPTTRDIPIILITGAAGKGIVEDPRNWSFHTGADGYIEKSGEEDLASLISTYIRGNPRRKKRASAGHTMTEIEIMTALSQLLDKQLYMDVKRLEDLNEKKNAFVANVSHELKSPLTIINGNMGLIKDEIAGPINDKQKRLVEISSKMTTRLARLVMDLLDISKIEAGMMKLERKKTSLVDVAEDALTEYEILIDEKSIDLKKEFDKKVSMILGDRERLTQVVINILNNAIKFTPEGGKICVRVMDDGGKVRFEIEDSGPGVDSADLSRMFDKFERILADKVEGTGLGLPIARDIVALHDGQIWAESKKGKGTKMIFTLAKA